MYWLAKRFAIFVLITGLAGFASAQTHIPGGVLPDNSVWTTANSPYIIDGDVTIGQDSSLTIDPGVTVEFTSGTSMMVNGLLTADGTSGSQITFTSTASTPAAGDWGRIEFVNTTDPATILNYCVIEYGGAGSRNTNLFYEAGSPTIHITNSTVRYSSGNGVTIRTSQLQISGTTFYGNANWGVYGDAFLATGTMISNSTIRQNGTGGIRIPNNALLSVQNVTVDSNDVGIEIGIGSEATVTDCDITDNTRGITSLHDADPNIHNNNIVGNAEYGIYHPGPNTIDARRNYWGDMNGPTNARYNPAGAGDRITNYVNFEPFMATQVINQITALNSDFTTNTVLDSGIYIIDTDIRINSGVTVTVNPGVILKFKANNRLNIEGVLHAVGQVDSQVVFTSYKDDSYGGDTNGDGAATDPSPGDWANLYFNGNSGSILQHAIVKFGGDATAMIEIRNDNVPVIDSSYFSRSYRDGIYIDGANSGMITNSYITGNNENGAYMSHSYSDYSHYEFYNTVFQGNGNHGLRSYSDDTPDVVEGCVFGYNGNSGMYVEKARSSQLIRNNEFRGNHDHGMVLVNSQSANSPHEVVIDSNLFVDNRLDGMVTSAAEIVGNTYNNNTYPISVTGYVGNVYNRLSDFGNETGPPNNFIGNRYNNAIGIRDIAHLSGQLNPVFPDDISSKAYVVTGGDVYVDNGNTLEITPGTIVKFEPNNKLDARGTLIAQGLPDQQIIFTSYRDSMYGGKTNAVSDTMHPAPGDWENIALDGGGANGSRLDNAKFLYGGDGSGNLYLTGTNIDSFASNLTVKHSQREGINIYHSKITLSNCVVDSNLQEGIVARSYYDNHSDVRITSSYIRDNGLSNSRYAALYATGGSTFREISNNHILRNDGDGIHSNFGVYPHSIVGNTITNNALDGMYVVTNSVPPKDVTITGNFVRNNGRDGIVSSGAHLTVNEIEGNRYPICVTGRLGNYYVDENGDDENTFINNTYNNAIGLRSDVDLSDTLSYNFPDSIDSHVYVVVDGNPTVDDPGVLTIEPGVIIKMMPNRRFNVRGKLVSVGTSDSMIVFTSYRDSANGGKTNLPTDMEPAAPGDWNYFYVDGGGHTSLLRYTKFLYGGDNGQMLQFSGVSMDSVVQHVTIQHSNRIGVDVYYSDVVFDACEIDSNLREGIRIRSYYGDNSDVRLRNSFVRDNGSTGNGYDGLWANYGSAFREVSNTQILRNAGSGIWTNFPDEIPQTFVDNTISNNGRDGIFTAMKSNTIDSLLTITGNTITDNGHEGIVSSRAIIKQNTISGNRYSIAVMAQISDSGTVNESGNVYSDNIIEGNQFDNTLALRGDVDVEGTLGGAWPDSVTSKTYVVLNDTRVSDGTHLTIVPGTILKFVSDTRLRSDGTLNAVGTKDDRIVFTSWKDDTFGGDTNEDSTATSAGPDDWQDVELYNGGSDDSHLSHVVIRFGGQSGQNLYLNNSNARVDSSFITFSDRDGIYAYQSNANLFGIELHDNVHGLRVNSGYNSSDVPQIHQSNIYNNSDYGVQNLTPSDTVDATLNYWGAASGPYHADLNPSGEGDAVSDGVKFDPYLTAQQGPLLGDVSLNGDVTAFDASLVLRHSVGSLTLTGDSLIAAEVSGQNPVSAYDASLILQYVAGSIITFPALGKPIQPKALAQALSIEAASGDAGSVVEMPIQIDGDFAVTSSDIHFTYDPNLIESVSVRKSESSEGMQLFSHTQGDTMRIAMAGSQPIDLSQPIVTLVLHLKNDVKGQARSSINFLTFRVNDVDLTSRVTGVDVNVRGTPTTYQLSQNYPNPFNPTTNIQYQLPENSKVLLAVYNLRGQKVATLVNKVQSAGYYQITWDGTNQLGHNVASGVYFYRVKAESKDSDKSMTRVKKMMYLK